MIDYIVFNILKPGKGEAVSVRGCGGPYNCEVLRLPYFLEYRLTECRDVSTMCQLPITPRKIPTNHFCYRL